MLKKGTFLNFVLYVDFFVTFAFGIVSWLFPYSTFGTILAIGEVANPLLLSVLSSLSVFYILIGIACFIATQMPQPQKIWFAYLMILRHAWIGIVGFQNVNQDWIIGNPWPDIFIHSAFVLCYLAGSLFISSKEAS